MCCRHAELELEQELEQVVVAVAAAGSLPPSRSIEVIGMRMQMRMPGPGPGPGLEYLDPTGRETRTLERRRCMAHTRAVVRRISYVSYDMSGCGRASVQ